MSDQVLHLINKIGALEAELEVEFARNGCDFRFNGENGRVNFEPEMRRLHNEQKTSLSRYILNARPLAVLSSPFVCGLIIPLVLLDISVSLFQAVCFPAFDIQKVRRSDYLVFDHRYLAYLNALEKLNCAYCSYANGIIAFFREVAGRAEQPGARSNTRGEFLQHIRTIQSSLSTETLRLTGSCCLDLNAEMDWINRCDLNLNLARGRPELEPYLRSQLLPPDCREPASQDHDGHVMPSR